MPCEGCHVEFTVFQRKRSCTDCKRFYCSNCLSTQKRTAQVTPRCLRCAIFAKRPLLRADLLQLKPKDLIFYLQSKHISTTGCVEKDELVGLVLNHVMETDATSPRSDSGSHAHINPDPTHTFNALKQTCQNFFSNITDNISDSFASFDGKTSKSSAARHANAQRPSQQTAGGTAAEAENVQEITHIFEQPRVSTREIPTYASFQNTSRSAAHSSTSPSTTSPSPTNTEMPVTQSGEQSRQMSPPPTNDDSQSMHQTAGSLVVSPSATMTRPTLNAEFQERNSNSDSNNPRSSVKSDCECSDDDDDEDDDDIDDPVAIFSELSSNRAESRAQLDAEPKSPLSQEVVAGSSTSPEATLASNDKPQTLSLHKAEVCDGDESSQSSFEELGAIGGISDDSKAATTDTNSSNMEQWQLLGNSINQCGNVATNVGRGNAENGLIFAEKLQVALLPASLQQSQGPALPPTAPHRVKKVVRRRSDSYLNRRCHPLSDEESSPTSITNTQIGSDILHEQAEGEEIQNEDESGNSVEGRQSRRHHSHCKRCGKNKTNIKRHVEKMRRHLESSHMSEEDIKRELKAFLVYLEKRTKSIDYSDTEDVATTAATSSFSGIHLTRAQQQQYQQNLYDDEMEGIHVYAGFDYSGIDSRFINLDNFDSLRELECLSVKQLKEVLMLNRVDYKGCCEKQELLERVERLWKNLKTCPAVEKLQTDELCKICMDAPIECVILECGHMATCTSCGKVLSECPICRQYIVRVVRFFRA